MMPAGHELDAQVAKAMGWVRPSERLPPRCDDCGWPIVPDGESGCWATCCSMRPSPEPRADRVPTCSTSSHLIEKMLAWLRTHGSFVGLNCYAEMVHVTLPASPCGYCSEGNDIPHALANLVVVVAKTLEAKP